MTTSVLTFVCSSCYISKVGAHQVVMAKLVRRPQLMVKSHTLGNGGRNGETKPEGKGITNRDFGLALKTP